MTLENEAARDLWSQIFSRMAELPWAAMNDTENGSDADRKLLIAHALLEAGWRPDEIERRMAGDLELGPLSNPNSPGVAPGLEAKLRYLSNRISEELVAMGIDSHRKVEVAIEPKAGVTAMLTNVIMTDEAIVSVSAFLFRWCGLIARAYTRTLQADISYWSRPSVRADKHFLISKPELSAFGAEYISLLRQLGPMPSYPSTPQLAMNSI